MVNINLHVIRPAADTDERTERSCLASAIIDCSTSHILKDLQHILLVRWNIVSSIS